MITSAGSCEQGVIMGKRPGGNDQIAMITTRAILVAAHYYEAAEEWSKPGQPTRARVAQESSRRRWWPGAAGKA